MAVSRRGIAISRRGMQKYTIFSWFCSCYLAPSPVSRNSANSRHLTSVRRIVFCAYPICRNVELYMSWYLYNFSSNSNFYVNRNMKEAPPQEKTLWGGRTYPYPIRSTWKGGSETGNTLSDGKPDEDRGIPQGMRHHNGRKASRKETIYPSPHEACHQRGHYQHEIA